MTVTYTLINVLLLVAIIALVTLVINLSVSLLATYKAHRFSKAMQERAEAHYAQQQTQPPYAPDTDPSERPKLEWHEMCKGSGRVADMDLSGGKWCIWCGTCHRKFDTATIQAAEVNHETKAACIPVHYN